MSIFNPYILLAVVLAIVGSFGGGYYKGSKDEVTRQQLEIAALNAAARQKEQALLSAVTTQATNFKRPIKMRNLRNSSVMLTLTLVLSGCGFLSKRPTAPYQPPQIPPLPAEIAFKQVPNLTERLLNLLSPSPTKEMPTPDNSTPVLMPTTPPIKP